MSQYDAGDDGREQSVEVRLRDAELRLAYYEKFGATLQEQMNAVVFQAATTTGEAEAEQAEIRAESERLRMEVQERQQESNDLRDEGRSLREERDGLNDEVARQRSVLQGLEQDGRDLAGQIRTRNEERDQFQNQIVTLTRESQELVYEIERRHAEADAIRRRADEEAAQILMNVQRNAEAIMGQAITGLSNLRAQATPQEPVMDVPAWSPPAPQEPAADTEAWNRGTAQDQVIETEAWRPVPFDGPADEGRSPFVGQEDDSAIEIHVPVTSEEAPAAVEQAEVTGEHDVEVEVDDRVPTQEVEIPRPLFSPPPPLAPVTQFAAVIEPLGAVPPARATLDDGVDAIVTRLLVRPPLDSSKIGEFRGALEDLPGVIRTEPESAAEPSGPLMVTHAADTSLLGSLLAIPGLDFRLISRGGDFLEIEVLEVSLSPR